MAIPRFLTHVRWLRVLPLLRVTPQTGYLPAVTDCPLCGGRRLYIYGDDILRGEWHHCRDCSSYGDMITLAARFWKLDVAATIRVLIEKGALSEIPDEATIQAHVEGQAFLDRVGALWREASLGDQIFNQDSSQRLHRLNLHPARRETWGTRTGRFLGASTRLQVEGVLRPGEHSRPGGPCPVFCGPNWRELLITPYYDLPGRIVGFHFIGRDMKAEDCFYRAVTLVYGGNRTTGLAMLDAALTGTHPELGNNVFIVDDVLVALRLQDRHLAHETTPLPLTALAPGSSKDLRLNNGVLAGKQLIFWGQRLTRELLRQSRGHFVSTHDGHTDPVQMSLVRRSSVNWLRRVEATAEPWGKVLETYLQQLDDPQAEVLLRYLDIQVAERDRLLMDVHVDTRRRVDRLLDGAGERRVMVGGYEVTETEGRWYYRKPRAAERLLLSEAVLRVDQVVNLPDASKTYYRGRVLYRGKEIPFLTDAREVESKAGTWLNRVLLKAEAGVCHYDRVASRLIPAAATQFHRPEFVRGIARLGWDEPEAHFVFQGFRIGRDGITDPTPAPSLGWLTTPTASLQLPEELHPDAIEQLGSDDPRTPVVWAVTAAVLGNITAPVFNRSTVGIGLIGPGAEFIGRAAATHLGCAEHEEVMNRTRSAHEVEREHGWPVVFRRMAKGSHAEFQRWAAAATHNCLIPLTPVEALGLGIGAGWAFIRSDTPHTSVVDYRNALLQLIPAYLVWLGREGMTLPTGTSHLAAVVESLALWFQSLGGREWRVRAALDHLDPDPIEADRDEVLARRLGLTLAQLEADGEIEVYEKLLSQHARKVPRLFRKDGHLFIPRTALNRILTRKGAPTCDGLLVTRALAGAGVLLDEPDYGSPPEPGWLVSWTWWEASCAEAQRRKRPSLRVVG